MVFCREPLLPTLINASAETNSNSRGSSLAHAQVNFDDARPILQLGYVVQLR